MARRMSFCSRCSTDCSWAISKSKCVAKFGSNRLSLFDSTRLDTYQKRDAFSTRRIRLFVRSNFQSSPIGTQTQSGAGHERVTRFENPWHEHCLKGFEFEMRSKI